MNHKRIVLPIVFKKKTFTSDFVKKCLGILLDSQLNWKIQLKSLDIRPKLSFAVISPNADSQSNYNYSKFNAQLLHTGAMRAAPMAASEVLLNVETLHIHFERVVFSTELRLELASQQTKTNYSHVRLWY